jgi:hypothetical protein
MKPGKTGNEKGFSFTGPHGVISQKIEVFVTTL